MRCDDTLLWTLSGGVKPPHVLGAGQQEQHQKGEIAQPLPPQATLTHPLAAARLRAAVLHAVLRASQVAVNALLGAQHHGAYSPTRLELLYHLLCRPFGRFFRAWAPALGACDLACTCAVARGVAPAPCFACAGRNVTCVRLVHRWSLFLSNMVTRASNNFAQGSASRLKISLHHLASACVRKRLTVTLGNAISVTGLAERVGSCIG